jgi:hypothetical protein
VVGVSILHENRSGLCTGHKGYSYEFFCRHIKKMLQRMNFYRFKIWCYCLLWCDAVYSSENFQTFRRNLLSSGWMEPAGFCETVTLNHTTRHQIPENSRPIPFTEVPRMWTFPVIWKVSYVMNWKIRFSITPVVRMPAAQLDGRSVQRLRQSGSTIYGKLRNDRIVNCIRCINIFLCK